MASSDDAERATPPHDARLHEALQSMRFAAGGPSYAEIAARVTRLRASRVGGARSVTVARSTVYDLFRPDRTRVDRALVADVILALGGSEHDAAHWRRHAAVVNSLGHRPESVAEAPAPPAAAPETPENPDDPEQPPHDPTPSRRHTATQRDADEPRTLDPRPPRTTASRVGVMAIIIALCTLANVVGGQLVLWSSLPLFLDMVGTAIASIVLGPWYGVLVAIATQLTGAAYHSSPIGLPFTAVGIVGALLWGYGTRSWGLGRTPVRFFVLTVMVALACTLVATPITLAVYGGYSAHVATVAFTDQLLHLGDALWTAVLSANLVSSLIDKMISGFIALTVGSSLVHRIDSHRRGRGADALLFDPPRLIFRASA
ncbi:ECF transporter S component [Microbacterium sp. KSW4-11]|uniref:ECF transporter S component n=1 Tax=Microbacterium gawkjiense TaxID=3067309 RepID=A0ABU3G6Y7_9MICO|nr:ECF transporter S component [Microbacterium sp. KSW4-11]MDT3315592.1 ECF transporter S component [Microbacterium sp. KSW4-11]